MSDEHLDPQQDPEQEERVRALLADLGSAPDAASMPPEVAARLDETLAGLVAEREETARRRRTSSPAVGTPRRGRRGSGHRDRGGWRRRGQPRGLQRQREGHRQQRGQLGRGREQLDGVAGRRRDHGSSQQSRGSPERPGRAAASRHRRVVRHRRRAAGAAALAGPGQRRQPAQVRAGRRVRPGRRHRLSRTEHRRRLHDHPGAVRRHPGRPCHPPCPGGRASRRGVGLRRRPRARQRPRPRLPRTRPTSPAPETPD